MEDKECVESLMKMLFLCNTYEDEGTFHRCFFWAKYLVRDGHSIRIIAISRQFPDLAIRRKIREGVEIVTLPALSRWKDYLFFIIRPFISIVHTLFQKYDLLYAFAVAEPLTAMPTVFHKILKRKPIYVDWDDWYSDDGFVTQKPFQLVMRPITNLLEKRVPLLADKVTVVSRFLRGKAVEIGVNPQKIFEISNGCDWEFIKPLEKSACRRELGIDGDRKVVLYMGRTSHQSFRLLLSAFEIIICKISEAVLLCLGELDVDSLRSLISGAKIRQDNLLLPGYQPYEKIPLYLGAADVLTLPMEDNSIEKARWPIRLGDYLASGRPIVASDIGEVGRVLREYGCGLVANNAEEFARQICTVLESYGKQRELGMKARTVAEHNLQWEKIVAQLSLVV